MKHVKGRKTGGASRVTRLCNTRVSDLYDPWIIIAPLEASHWIQCQTV